tara:strand:+ start:632 stop:1060 length:429 start_codon:yes stop_codon:yes gene_type:complete
VALIGLDIPAGAVRNGTDLDSSGRWRDVNLVRWENNSARPVGGWQKREVNAQFSVSAAASLADNFVTVVTTTPHGLSAAPSTNSICSVTGLGNGSISGFDPNDPVAVVLIINSPISFTYLVASGVVNGDTFATGSAIVSQLR